MALRAIYVASFLLVAHIFLTYLVEPRILAERKQWQGTIQFSLGESRNGSSTTSIALEHDDPDSSPCDVTQNIANCSYRHLTRVPVGLPVNITTLDLAHNQLTDESLHPGVFSSYPNLINLSLASNLIEHLGDGIFEGLLKLKFLSLYNNSLQMNEDLRWSIAFSPLNRSLDTLLLNHNDKDTSNSSSLYPDMALSYLPQLKVLYLDGLKEKSFGPGFANLKQLRNLTLYGFGKYGYCTMMSLENDTFKYVSSLHHLVIANCKLNANMVSKETFLHLGQLKSLDISYNFNLGLEAIGELMYGLRNNTNFKYINLQYINKRYAPCIVLYANTMKYFRGTAIEFIDATNNEIEMIEAEVLKMLPPTLKTLTIKNNKIMFGAYWKDMHSFSGVETLILDDEFLSYKFPEKYPDKTIQCHGSVKNARESGFVYGPEDTAVVDEAGSCVCGDISVCSEIKHESGLILPVPPNLKNVSMRSYGIAYSVHNITFCPNNQLEYVDISLNRFTSLQGTLRGLSKLKYLNLGSCFIKRISENFFDHLPALEHLSLHQNNLGDALHFDFNGEIFGGLGNIRHLNLSYTNIYSLNKLTFKNLDKIRTLDLSANRMEYLAFDIDHMVDLRLLDLRQNEISSLPQYARDHISKLLKTNASIHVDMRENGINCDCENLPFLEWVVSSNVFGSNYSRYFCHYKDSDGHSKEVISGYQEVVTILQGECKPHMMSFLLVITFSVIGAAVFVGLLIRRYRWTLTFWYHAAKLKFYSGGSRPADDFQYDVFISYAKEDESFVLQKIHPELATKRGLRILIHGEMFQAGRYIADNIHMAVTQSRRTLVLVTPHMVASRWCTYELQMARQEAISSGRNVLTFLFKDEMPASELGFDMVTYIRSNTYIIYPPQARHRERFWTKLAHDLKTA